MLRSLLSALREPRTRGGAWAERMHAMLNEHRCCIACGKVGAPAFKCPGGIHCYCEKCGPGPACECQP